MAKQISRKRYGDTNIGGKAKVQLGDTHLTKHITVDTLNLSLPDELVAVLQHAITNVNQADQKLLFWNQRTPRSVPSKKRSTIGGVSSQSLGPLTNDTVSIRHSDENVDTHSILSMAQRWMRSLLQRPASSVEAQTIARIPRIDDRALVHTGSSREVVLRDHGIIALTVLSCMARKNISMPDLIGYMTSFASDDLLPLLLMVICIGMYRYITAQSISRAPPQLCWDMEDAYGFSIQLSMDVLVDYSVFQQSLSAHYLKSNRSAGAALVSINRFHLLLGSRRGIAISNHNWSTAATHIKSGRKVINAVFFDTENRKCLTCQTDMTITDCGEFHCQQCHTFHRDVSAMGLQSALQSQPHPQPHATRVEDTTTNSNIDAYFEWIAPHYQTVPLSCSPDDLRQIKNFDLRLRPRQESSIKIPDQSVNESDNDSGNEGDGENANRHIRSVRARRKRQARAFIQHSKPVAAQQMSLTLPAVHSDDLEYGTSDNERDVANPTNIPPTELWVRPSSPPRWRPRPGLYDNLRPPFKGILKPPRTDPFPEDPDHIREGTLPAGTPSAEIPPGARWTKINRRLVNPEALERAHERFEERDDYVIVLRVLSREEIQKLADKTQAIRAEREERYRSKVSAGTSIVESWLEESLSLGDRQ